MLPHSNRTWDSDPVDAKHNRLWFFGGPQFCPLKSMTLTGPMENGPAIPESAVGSVACHPDAIGFPQDGVVVGGHTGNENYAWRVDLSSGTGERLALPQSKSGRFVKWISYAMSHLVGLSPDGEVFVVARSSTAWDEFDRSHEAGGELDVIQLRPLALLGVVQLKGGCDFGGVAVDHRNGSATVLQRRCGKWERNEFPVR
jgi:hypothetical protein